MTEYDERELIERIGALGRAGKTAFAAACAERLLPLYRRYVDAAGVGAPEELAGIVEQVWEVLRGADHDLTDARQVAVDLVPDDDAPGEWVLEGAYAQNAAAAVAYAVGAWLSDDAQQAVWAARQVFDAAEYAARPPARGLVIREAGADDPTLSSAVVQAAVRTIGDDLSEIERFGTCRLNDLRQRLRRESAEWLALFP